MRRSLALWLHLAIAERRPAIHPPDRRARPEGELIWIIASSDVRPATLRQIQRVLRAARPQLSLLVTCEGDNPEMIAAQSGEILTDRQPGERMGDARAFLDHWRPLACLILGNALPAALICSLHQRAIPVLAADRTASVGARVPFWRKGRLVALLQRFDVILAQDSESVFGLRRLAGQSLRVELGGRIEETTDPL
ncbi:MAG: glycosyltransferase N-terminal domain-containing protein, partial [Paracoccaceae bacterium]